VPVDAHRSLACQLLFPTPLWTFALPDALDAGRFAAAILTLRSETPQGIQITNQGGWHSPTNLLDHPPLAELFPWIAASCQAALAEIGWDFSKARPCFNNAWAMVNGQEHSVRAHLHPSSLFSGVVYLQAGPSCGNIAFLDPRNGAQELLPPLTQSSRSVLNRRVEQAPSDGLLLLFPAWLCHEVGCNNSTRERICVSFNIGMKPVLETNAAP